MVTPERVAEIVNRGGRPRQEIETLFNVGKNGGFGLEHAFCANEQASRNLHVLMQVASVLGQVLVRGVLKRLPSASPRSPPATYPFRPIDLEPLAVNQR